MQVRDLRLLKEYDVWATAKVLEHVGRLTPEQFTTVPEGGYDSVRDTLVHTLSNERYWRTRWQTGESIPGLDRNDFPTCASIAERWRVEDELTRDFLASLTDADLERDPFGIGSLGMMIVNLLQHGVQHRTEAAMMLTAYGYSPGDINLIFYLEELPRGE